MAQRQNFIYAAAAGELSRRPIQQCQDEEQLRRSNLKGTNSTRFKDSTTGGVQFYNQEQPRGFNAERSTRIAEQQSKIEQQQSSKAIKRQQRRDPGSIQSRNHQVNLAASGVQIRPEYKSKCNGAAKRIAPEQRSKFENINWRSDRKSRGGRNASPNLGAANYQQCGWEQKQEDLGS